MQNKRGISQAFNGTTGWEFRTATIFDAFDVSEILTTSIRQLCQKDHDDDPDKLAKWLCGKDPQSLITELSQESGYYIATLGGIPAGAGAIVPATGEIKLLYVAPRMAGQGAGAALLTFFERTLAHLGHRDLHLMATQTAIAFYEAHGWISSGPLSPCCGIQGWPMRKTLPVAP